MPATWEWERIEAPLSGDVYWRHPSGDSYDLVPDAAYTGPNMRCPHCDTRPRGLTATVTAVPVPTTGMLTFEQALANLAAPPASWATSTWTPLHTASGYGYGYFQTSGGPMPYEPSNPGAEGARRRKEAALVPAAIKDRRYDFGDE
jgi:hypothetical protein